MSRHDPTELLVRLVRTPSPSGDEIAAAAVLADWAGVNGLAAEVDDAAVRLVVEGPNPGHVELFHTVSTDGPKPQTRSIVEELLRTEGLMPERRSKSRSSDFTP